MSLEQVNAISKPAHHGGGLFGSIAGTIVGGLAAAAGVGVAAATGGIGILPAAGLISSGLGGGGLVGSLIGNAVDPATPGVQGQTIPHQEAPAPQMPIQSFENHPELQLAHLSDAKQALQQDGTLPGPQAEQYMGMINQAQEKLKQRLQVGVG